MTDKFKKRVREHAKKHGMSYQAALQQLTIEDKAPAAGLQGASYLYNHEEEEEISVELPAWVHIPRKSFDDGLVIFSLPNCDETDLETMYGEVTHQLGKSDQETSGVIVTNLEVDVTELDRDQMGKLGWAPLKGDGAFLYKLPPPNDDMATEYVDEAFHAWVEYARKLEAKINPPPDTSPKEIIVNGRKSVTTKDALSYADVLELAYPGIDPTRILSVVVSYRDGRDRTLIPDESVRVESRMIFSAYDTSNA